ncbi:hypothetical protein D3C76_1354960 [compost metagenome]
MLLNTCGSCFFTQRIFDAGQVADIPTWPVVRCTCSRPSCSSSQAASSVARLSIQTIAGRRGSDFSSRKNNVSPWADMPSETISCLPTFDLEMALDTAILKAFT